MESLNNRLLQTTAKEITNKLHVLKNLSGLYHRDTNEKYIREFKGVGGLNEKI